VDERELTRKAELAELLLHVSRELGETLDPERIYDRFHELLGAAVEHDGIVVSSYDEEDGLIRCEYAWVEGNRLDPELLPPLPLNREGGGMQSRVIVTGESLLVNDVGERIEQEEGTYYDVDREGTIRRLPDSGPPEVKAAMMVPVRHEGRVVGVVQLMSDHVQYAPEQLELLEGLVAQMHAAVRNARLQREQRRLEAAEAAALAVAAEREQAAHVLEAVGDGIFLVDGQGVVRFWNRAAELATGLSAGPVLDRPVSEVFSHWDELSRQIPVAGRGSAAHSTTLPAAVGGRELWLSFVAVGSGEGVVYAFRDVTVEHALEEAKSDFIATISHELRTPMAAVYGASMTLLREDVELDAGRRHELVQMIATQSARLSQITEEVLLTNQLDRGAVAVRQEPVDVGTVVRAAVDAIQSQHAAPGGLAVEVPEGVAAYGDADRIQQVLVNLLDNAIKYGGREAVAVRVEAADGPVRISVSDSGPGIPLTEQERIFEKFFRADPQLRRSPGGTGLGLYIARELVERMEGRLAVSSAPGAGATFVVELPRA
jgi:PAS domain S-box-containing protein